MNFMPLDETTLDKILREIRSVESKIDTLTSKINALASDVNQIKTKVR